MAVYTEVGFEEAAALAASVGIGELVALAPCAGGIENTNYFADTANGRYVLTLFERLSAAELPFYLALSQPNLRGLAWWEETVPVVLPHLDAARAELMTDELAYQRHLAASSAYA